MLPVDAAAFHRGRSGRAGAVAATVSGHNAAMFDTPAGLLTVAISTREPFDLEASNTLFEAQGIDAYAEHPASREEARTRLGKGKSGDGRVTRGGRRLMQKKK